MQTKKLSGVFMMIMLIGFSANAQGWAADDAQIKSKITEVLEAQGLKDVHFQQFPSRGSDKFWSILAKVPFDKIAQNPRKLAGEIATEALKSLVIWSRNNGLGLGQNEKDSADICILSDTTGDTGQSRTYFFGSAYYNPRDDKISWSRSCGGTGNATSWPDN